MSNFVIEIEDLNQYFADFQALKNINLKLQAGECLALAGHNGAGKSTLIKIILGLISPSSGKVQVFAQNANNPANKNRSAYLPETINLYPQLSALETINFFAKLKKQSCKNNLQLLERVGIGSVANKKVKFYSKGMRQRLALALCLISKPDLLLLDEPTTGLDPASRQDFYALLQDLRKEGCSIIISSHALSELFGQIDRIAILQKGVKIADDNLQNLRQQSGLLTQIIAHFSAENLPQIANWEALSATTLGIKVTEEEKSKVIANLYRQHLPQNLEIIPPSLDDTYAYFLAREN